MEPEVVDYIELNGRKLTYEQFEMEKALLTEKHMKLVEVSTKVYRTRLED